MSRYKNPFIGAPNAISLSFLDHNYHFYEISPSALFSVHKLDPTL